MQSNPELETILLAHVSSPNYKPVKPRTIAKQLKLSQDDHPLLKKAIKKLVKQGKIGYGSNHVVSPSQAPANRAAASSAKAEGPSGRAADAGKTGKAVVVGVFRRTSSGFGFVRPVGTLREAGRSLDIY